MVLDIISVLVILGVLALVIYKVITDKDVQLALLFSTIVFIIVGIIGWSIFNVVQMFMNG